MGDQCHINQQYSAQRSFEYLQTLHEGLVVKAHDQFPTATERNVTHHTHTHSLIDIPIFVFTQIL